MKNLLVVAAMIPFAAQAETLVAVAPNVSGGLNFIVSGASECVTGLKFIGHSPSRPDLEGCVLMVSEDSNEIAVLFQDRELTTVDISGYARVPENDYEGRHGKVL